MPDTKNWNRNPGRNDNTLADEVSIKLILYGILGYLPDSPCAVVFTDGEYSHFTSQKLEELGFAVTRLCDENKDGNAPRGDIIQEAEIQGFESSKVEEALDRLKRNGQIYEPVHGKYKITEY